MRAISVILLLLGIVLAQEDDALYQFTESNHDFSIAFHKEIVNTTLKGKGNLICCPISAELVLVLTQLGAKGSTAKELSDGLFLRVGANKTKEAIKALIPQLQNNNKFTLTVADKIFVKQGLNIKPDYQDVATNVFESSVQSVDFNQRESAAQTINSFVEEKTNNKIRDIVKPGDFNAQTKLVLVNTLYFKGNWTQPFDTRKTIDAPFFTNIRDSIQVPTMHLSTNFNYFRCGCIRAQFVEMFFQGGDVKLTIVLPFDRDGLSGLENDLVHVHRHRKYTNQYINLSLPKFSILSDLPLIPVLHKLGIHKVFSESESDLSGIADTGSDHLFVNSVAQKAFINVTESGAEAAAATVGVIGTTSVHPNPIDFNVDHQFFYYLTYVPRNLVLFSGRVVNPNLH